MRELTPTRTGANASQHTTKYREGLAPVNRFTSSANLHPPYSQHTVTISQNAKNISATTAV